jgi:Zn-dependent protease
MYDSYQPPGDGTQRLLKAMSASFRVGRFFGVEVRVFWLAALLLPFITFIEFVRFGDGLPLTTMLAMTLAVELALFVIIYTHEMFHIAAGWRYGIRTPLITISPMGGLAHMSQPAPRPAADMVISLAGPASHLVWLAVLTPLYMFSEDLFPGAWWWARWFVWFLWSINITLLLFNLLPFYPMDGGRVLQAFLSTRTHPNRALTIAARVGQFGALAFFMVGLLLFFRVLGGEETGSLYGAILVAIALTNFMACRQALVAARYQASPYGGGDYLAPWENDPEAWKQGGDPYEWDSSGGPGGQGWLERRREKKRVEHEQSMRELDAEVDRILVRINEVGMQGLSRKERKTLERASREKRAAKDKQI